MTESSINDLLVKALDDIKSHVNGKFEFILDRLNSIDGDVKRMDEKLDSAIRETAENTAFVKVNQDRIKDIENDCKNFVKSENLAKLEKECKSFITSTGVDEKVKASINVVKLWIAIGVISFLMNLLFFYIKG